MKSTRLLLIAVSLAWAATMALARPQEPAFPGANRASLAHSGALFTHSDNCVACHNNLVTPQGEDVSIGVTWRSTMMANSARDPYWHASVRRETIDHPGKSADIQNECATCHMPIAERMARAENRKAELFPLLPMAASEDSETHALAADGVSCTVCHQVSKDKLGTPESFNGNYVLNPARPDGIREIFGPFPVDPGRRRIMRSVTGFEQVEGAHVKQSELCATCHTLKTQAFGPDGAVVGSLSEQANYQEWLHSDFPGEKRSCQSCHMPSTPGPIRVSSVLGEYRDALSRHVFVGGNAFMVRLLNRYRSELGVSALPSELESTARATLRQLAEDTATVTLDRVTQPSSSSPLAFDVVIRNLTGHKFPTGYPARRTWLHVTVRDDQGRVAFESGAVDAQGQIAGNDSDRDASRFEPHYARITGADQVQIYETILGDMNGKPTTGLLTATQYLKDNRLLPRGFDKSTAGADIAVFGDAAKDGSFTGGSDRVNFSLAGLAPGQYTIEIELRYQPIAFRWANNLAGYDAPEPKLFLGYYRSLSSASSAIVARATGGR